MNKKAFRLNQDMEVYDNYIDLYWSIPVFEVNNRILEEVERKGKLGAKRVIDQIKQLKLPVSLIFNDISKEGEFRSFSVVFSRRLDISRLDKEQKILVFKFLNRFGFVEGSLKVANRRDVERRIQRSRLPDREKLRLLNEVDDLENKDAWKVYPESVQRNEFEKGVCLPSGTCCRFDWTGHGAYRSELRDRKPEEVNEDACKLVDSLSSNFPDKRTMKVRGRDGLIVMDFDKSKKPIDIDIITTYPKTAKEKNMMNRVSFSGIDVKKALDLVKRKNMVIVEASQSFSLNKNFTSYIKKADSKHEVSAEVRGDGAIKFLFPGNEFVLYKEDKMNKEKLAKELVKLAKDLVEDSKKRRDW